MKNPLVKIILIYAMLCFIWGSTWLAIRLGLESLTPLFSCGIRFVIASIFILIIMKIQNVNLQMDRMSIRLYFMMGYFSFVIPFGLVYWAEQFVPSGIAAVLFAVYPFCVLIFSYYRLPAEAIGIYKITGIILGFAGIVTIFSDSFTGNITDYLLGMFAVVLSGIMQAWIATTIKKFGHHLHPLSMNFVPMLLAGISLLIIGYLSEDLSHTRIDANAILSVLYLAFFGSVITFTSFYWLLKRVNMLILSLIAFLTPITALILGYFVYGEELSTRHFIGSATVLLGVLVANFDNLIKIKAKEIIKESA